MKGLSLRSGSVVVSGGAKTEFIREVIWTALFFQMRCAKQTFEAPRCGSAILAWLFTSSA